MVAIAFYETFLYNTRLRKKNHNSKMTARIFILSLLFTLVSYASDTPQMLEKKLASASREEKVKILNEIAFAYRKMSPEKTREYGGKALQLARQLSDKE